MDEGYPIIGYVDLYFRIVGEKETYYACFSGDFGKPLSRRRLNKIKRDMKKSYSKFDRIHSVEFCSIEEFEKNTADREMMVYRHDN